MPGRTTERTIPPRGTTPGPLLAAKSDDCAEPDTKYKVDDLVKEMRLSNDDKALLLKSARLTNVLGEILEIEQNYLEPIWDKIFTLRPDEQKIAGGVLERFCGKKSLKSPSVQPDDEDDMFQPPFRRVFQLAVVNKRFHMHRLSRSLTRKSPGLRQDSLMIKTKSSDHLCIGASPGQLGPDEQKIANAVLDQIGGEEGLRSPSVQPDEDDHVV